jgi:hypothetical protein
MYNRTFWKRTIEHAVRGGAIAALATLGTTAVDARTLDWAGVGGFTVGGMLLSLLASVASAGKGDPSSPTLT